MTVGPIEVADRGRGTPAAPIRAAHLGHANSGKTLIVFCDAEDGCGERNLCISARLWPDLKRKIDGMLAIDAARHRARETEHP